MRASNRFPKKPTIEPRFTYFFDRAHHPAVPARSRLRQTEALHHARSLRCVKSFLVMSGASPARGARHRLLLSQRSKGRVLAASVSGRADSLDSLGPTQEELAQRIGVPFQRIDQIAKQMRSITPDTDVWFVLTRLWDNRVPKTQAMGIHGVIFCKLPDKRQYYPTLKDEEAINPDGTRLRRDGAYSLTQVLRSQAE
jgi:hypothetical protein